MLVGPEGQPSLAQGPLLRLDAERGLDQAGGNEPGMVQTGGLHSAAELNLADALSSAAAPLPWKTSKKTMCRATRVGRFRGRAGGNAVKL